MRKGLLGVLVLLMAAWARWGAGSELGGSLAKDTTNVAAGFAESSAAQVNLYAPGEEARSFCAGNAGGSSGERAAAEPAAATPRPKFVFGDRDDYRGNWEWSVEFFRFQSVAHRARAWWG